MWPHKQFQFQACRDAASCIAHASNASMDTQRMQRMGLSSLHISSAPSPLRQDFWLRSHRANAINIVLLGHMAIAPSQTVGRMSIEVMAFSTGAPFTGIPQNCKMSGSFGKCSSSLRKQELVLDPNLFSCLKEKEARSKKGKVTMRLG